MTKDSRLEVEEYCFVCGAHDTELVMTQVPLGIQLLHHNLRRLSQLVEKTENQRHSCCF